MHIVTNYKTEFIKQHLEAMFLIKFTTLNTDYKRSQRQGERRKARRKSLYYILILRMDIIKRNNLFLFSFFCLFVGLTGNAQSS